MLDKAKVQRNVQRLIDLGAPESDIDAYVQNEIAASKAISNQPRKDSILSEFTKGLESGFRQDNPRMLGAGTEAIIGENRFGTYLQDLANRQEVRQPSVLSTEQVEGIGDAARFALGQIGKGVAQIAPMAVTGLGGAAIGSAAGPVGTVVGGIAGASAPSALMNAGDVYLQLQQEGLSKEDSSFYAKALAAPITALDVASFKGLTAPVKEQAKKHVLKVIANKIKTGAITEGSTEGLQQTIQEAAAAYATGNLNIEDRARNVLDAALGGAVTGGAIKPFSRTETTQQQDNKSQSSEQKISPATQDAPIANLQQDINPETIKQITEQLPQPEIKKAPVYVPEPDSVVKVETPKIIEPSVKGEFALPKNLASAKPRYNENRIVFASDLDKALYIANPSSVKRSAYHDQYLKALKDYGLTDVEISKRGKEVRDAVKASKPIDGVVTLNKVSPKITEQESVAVEIPSYITEVPDVTDVPEYIANPPEQIIADEDAYLTQAKTILDNLKATPLNKINKFGVVIKDGKPLKTISQFVKELGGIPDSGGDLKFLGVVSKARPGVIVKGTRNKNGLGIDDVALRVVEAGYFPQTTDRNQISFDQIREAIEQDIFTPNKIYPSKDLDYVNNILGHIKEYDQYFRYGIDVDSTPEAVAEVLRNNQAGFIKVGPIIEAMKKPSAFVDGFIDIWNGYGAQQFNDFLIYRNKMKGSVAKTEKQVKSLVSNFNDMTVKDSEQVLEFLTSENAKADIIQNSKYRKPAMEAKAMFADFGQKLVNAGILDQAQYDKWRGAYLPKIYADQILDEISGQSQQIKMRDAGYTKGRTEESLLGEIRNPAFLIMRGMMLEAKDVAIFNLMNKTLRDSNMAPQDQFVKFNDQIVTPRWLRNYQNKLRKQLEWKQGDQLQETISLIKDIDGIVQKAERNARKYESSKDLRRLPDNAQLGYLRGAYVNKRVYDDVWGHFELMNQDNSFMGLLTGRGKLADTITRLWKTSKVVWNPPTWVRNIVGNAVHLQLSGIPFHKIPSYTITAINEIKNKGKAYQVALDNGIIDGTFTSQEALRMADDMKTIMKMQFSPYGILGSGKLAKYAANARHALARGVDSLGDGYQFIEQVFKVAKIREQLDKGATPEQAAMEANKWLFDYSFIPQTVRQARQNPILLGSPFLTYTYKSFPLMIEVAAKHPMRLLPYVAMPYLISQAFLAMNPDMSEDDLEKLKQTLPVWAQRQNAIEILPWRDDNGNWQFVDFGYMLPWSGYKEGYDVFVRQVEDTSRTAQSPIESAMGYARGAAEGVGMAFGISQGPLAQLIATLESGKDTFTERPIYSDGDPASVKGSKMLEYMWNWAMPPFVGSTGAAQKIMEAWEGREVRNPSLQEQITFAQAASRMFGLNAYPLNPSESVVVMQLQNKRLIDETKKSMASIMRDQSKTPQEREITLIPYKGNLEYLLEESKRLSNLSRGITPQMEKLNAESRK